MNLTKLFILVLVLVSAVRILGQSGSEVDAENQFNFWVGEWDVFWFDENGKEYKGENKVKALFGGKVIEENFDALDAAPLKGKSFSVYNKHKQKWEQTWVDNNGSFMVFEGEKKEDSMILNRSIVINGKNILQRMIFYNISENTFNWDWQKSEDGGKSWQILWKINYVRRAGK